MSYIDFIKSQGYDVYVRDTKNPTYCFYTDGKNIGYAQWSYYRASVSTVHMPNKHTGTGFGVGDKINTDTLKKGLGVYPEWYRFDDSVRKYANMEAYLKASKWNSELIKV